MSWLLKWLAVHLRTNDSHFNILSLFVVVVTVGGGGLGGTKTFSFYSFNVFFYQLYLHHWSLSDNKWRSNPWDYSTYSGLYHQCCGLIVSILQFLFPFQTITLQLASLLPSFSITFSALWLGAGIFTFCFYSVVSCYHKMHYIISYFLLVN